MDSLAHRTTARTWCVRTTVLATAFTAIMLTPPSAAAMGSTNAAEPMVTTPITRITDTREGIGAPNLLQDDETVRIRVAGTVTTIAGSDTSANAAVPADADAVVLNMTAVDAGEAGFFTAWPAGEVRPTTSNLNFTRGETVANSATIPVGEDGSIDIYARGQAHLLLDVAGYHRNGTYTATTAQRHYDSRDDDSPGVAGTVDAKSLTHIPTGAAEGDLVTLNVTTDRAEAPGFFSVWSTPAGEGDSLSRSPATSTLNYTPGMIVSNTAEVRVGVGGMVTVYSHERASLIVDEIHRHAAADADEVAVIYDRPHRAYDSRVDGPQKSANLQDPRYWISRRGGIAGRTEVRNGAEHDAQAIIVNLTVTNAPSKGYLSLNQFLVEGTRPSTSSLNYAAGDTRANRVIVPLDLYGYISAFASNQADVIVDLVGYIPKSPINPEPVQVDLSAASPITHFQPSDSRYVVDAANVSAIRFDADDLDANGQTDWRIDGNTAQLSHPYARTIAEYRIVAGAPVGGRATQIVEYTGSPHAWREEGTGWRSTTGAVNHYRPSVMQVPLRNHLTGETAVGEFHFRGHWHGTDLNASGETGQAPWLSELHVRVPVPAEPVEVTSHEPRVHVLLPEAFMERAAGDVDIIVDDLPATRAGSNEKPGLIGAHTNGDTTVPMTLPPVSEFHHEDTGSIFWKYPIVHIRLRSHDAQGNPMTANFSVLRT